MSSALLRSYRSELNRLLRPSTLLVGIGLTAIAAVVTSFVILNNTGDPDGGAVPGAGVQRTIEQLEASNGFLLSIDLLADFVGLIALAVWAIAVASDYSTGLIRLLVQAQPNRIALIGGKILALTTFTTATSLVAVGVTTFTAFPAAEPAGIDTTLWTTEMANTILSGYLNLTIATVTWGAIGLLIASLTRSAGTAIGIGVGWILVVELIVSGASADVADFLPGGTISAVAAGGTPNLAWLTALGLAAIYCAASLTIATVAFARRDVVS